MLSSLQEALLALNWALDHVTVSDIVDCQELLDRFNLFVGTGTLAQQQRLCPHASRSASARHSTPTHVSSPRYVHPMAGPRDATTRQDSVATPSTPGTSSDIQPQRRQRRRLLDGNYTRPRAKSRPRESPRDSLLQRPQSDPAPSAEESHAEYLYDNSCLNSRDRRDKDTVMLESPSEVLSEAPLVLSLEETLASERSGRFMNSSLISPAPSSTTSVSSQRPSAAAAVLNTLNSDRSVCRSSTSTSLDDVALGDQSLAHCFQDLSYGFLPPAALLLPPATLINSGSLHPSTPRSLLQTQPIVTIKPSLTEEGSILIRARTFFESRLGSRTRQSRYLVRAVQGFIEGSTTALDLPRDLWGSKSEIFVAWGDSGSVARIRRLYEGHQRIKYRREEYACADRFCYIFLEHDLDELAKSEHLVLSQGRGRKTAALHMQAESINTTVEVVRAERKAGRAYRQLLMEGGPGLLLRLGNHVSTIWERKLSRTDVSLILIFLRNQLPDVYAMGAVLNGLAAQALLDGFVAYGWEKEEVVAAKSVLINQLKSFTDMSPPGQGLEQVDLPLDSCETSRETVVGSQSTSPVGQARTSTAPYYVAVDLTKASSPPSLVNANIPATVPSSSPVCTQNLSSCRLEDHVRGRRWDELENFFTRSDSALQGQIDVSGGHDTQCHFCSPSC